MFDYLQKFKTLPQNLRDSVSSPAAMSVISELENRYKIDLAATVMKVMTKIIPLADLSIYFVSDFSLEQDVAKKLTAELKEKLFFPAANYLGYNASYSFVIPKTSLTPSLTPAPTVTPIAPVLNSVTPAITTFSDSDRVIKSSGVTFPGLDLNFRFKSIITTYLKGVRSRIDTRLTLSKEIISGGLGLDHKTIDKIFNICDQLRAGQILPSGAMVQLPNGGEPAKSGLEKIRGLYEKSGEARDIPYDLQAAIKKGDIKKPSSPLNLPIPEEKSEKLLEGYKDNHNQQIVPSQVTKTFETTKNSEIKQSAVAPVILNTQVSQSGLGAAVATAAAAVSAPIIPAALMVDSIRAIPTPIPAIVQSSSIPNHISDTSLSPKINRPPEKKPGIFSKLFRAKNDNPINPVSENISPINQAGVAALRTAAAIPQNKASVFAEPNFSPISTDSRLIPKVMGPLEELRYLDITNFRRLGASPEEAILKIESKIKLLEKDGYDKMINGVAAWRESPVNFLYLKMGQESLNKGLSFKQYTTNCQTSGAPGFLLWEEIEGIMTLNSRLMF